MSTYKGLRIFTKCWLEDKEEWKNCLVTDIRAAFDAKGNKSIEVFVQIIDLEWCADRWLSITNVRRTKNLNKVIKDFTEFVPDIKYKKGEVVSFSDYYHETFTIVGVSSYNFSTIEYNYVRYNVDINRTDVLDYCSQRKDTDFVKESELTPKTGDIVKINKSNIYALIVGAVPNVGYSVYYNKKDNTGVIGFYTREDITIIKFHDSLINQY